ncbi:hypothetical protein RZS08_02375, partial [Arthrospira platensis SPKY1]|nr:hypothetical protein [Arthrospira platensis SPKY1]
MAPAIFNRQSLGQASVLAAPAMSGLRPAGDIVPQARRLRLVIAQHSARRVEVVAHRQAGHRVKAAARIAFDAVINDPALAAVRIIGNGGPTLFQHARIAATV